MDEQPLPPPHAKKLGPLPTHTAARPVPRPSEPLSLKAETDEEVVDVKARRWIRALASDIERIIYIIKAVGWTIAAAIVLAIAALFFSSR